MAQGSGGESMAGFGRGRRSQAVLVERRKWTEAIVHKTLVFDHTMVHGRTGDCLEGTKHKECGHKRRYGRVLERSARCLPWNSSDKGGEARNAEGPTQKKGNARAV
jgi:hypothetical protein